MKWNESPYKNELEIFQRPDGKFLVLRNNRPWSSAWDTREKANESAQAAYECLCFAEQSKRDSNGYDPTN